MRASASRRAVLTILVAAGLLSAPFAILAQACDGGAERANLDFAVKDMHGANVAMSDYEGQVILLDFWATWCVPCRMEMPWFAEFFDKYEEQGFTVLALNIEDPVEPIQRFAEQYGMDFPVLIGAEEEELKQAYGPPVGYPTAFIIGRDGRICKIHSGFTEKGTFEQEILALL